VKTIKFKSKTGITTVVFNLAMHSDLSQRLNNYNTNQLPFEIDGNIDLILQQNIDLMYSRLYSKYGK
jgi:hypothetical protein